MVVNLPMNSFNGIEQFSCAEMNSFCVFTLGSCLDVCEDKLQSFFSLGVSNVFCQAIRRNVFFSFLLLSFLM